MCLIAVAWQRHPDYPLVIAANRDEFHARPTQAATFWAEHPGLCAGRDLEAGGTWLGITRGGRFAAITNRRGHPAPPSARSRGLLTLGFLLGTAPAGDYAESLRADCDAYAGFNLLAGELDGELWYLGNDAGPALHRLEPGVYGLSNAMLDTPWPKLLGAREELAALLCGEPEPEAVFALLADRSLPPDHELPDTGVGIEYERRLGPRFICSPDYGTRTSTCVRAHRAGWVELTERSFDAAGVAQRTVQHRFARST